MRQARRRFFKQLIAGPAALACASADAATWQRIGSGASAASASLSRVKQISTGCCALTSVLLRADGVVAGVGDSISGALGTTSTPVKSLSALVSGLSNISTISMGDRHLLALVEDGTVLALGANGSGQLGNNTTTNSSTPVSVQTVSNVVAIAAGGRNADDAAGFSLFLQADGTVYSTGQNDKYQLGTGNTTDKKKPTQVSGVSNVIAISAGGSFSTYLTADGNVYWNGTINVFTSSSPSQINYSNINNKVVAIAAGGSHAMYLLNTGVVMSQGIGGSGQLGNGWAVDQWLAPVQMSGLSNVVAIAAGTKHSVMLTADGKVWGCGDNSTGALGVGNNNNVSSPVQMLWQSNVVGIAAGSAYTLLMDVDGNVWGVGDNGSYQVGDGTSTDRLFATSMKVNWV